MVWAEPDGIKLAKGRRLICCVLLLLQDFILQWIMDTGKAGIASLKFFIPVTRSGNMMLRNLW